MPNDLYHYGVKGMKWGVRRNNITSNGSQRSVKKLDRAIKLETKYNNNNTNRSRKKFEKAYKKYDRSLSKDIDKASKFDDKTDLKKLIAGQTYLHFMMNKKNSKLSSKRRYFNL